MRRFLLTVATAVTALTATACGDATGVGTNVVGEYELIRVNGQLLPASSLDGDIIYHAGLLELESDGRFIDILQYRFFNSTSIQQDEWYGSWERSGSEILLEYDRGGRIFAERTSSTRLLLEDEAGNRFEYRRL